MRGSLIFKGKNKVFRVSSPNVALLLLGGRHGFFLSRAKAETNHEIKSKRRTSIDVHKPIFFIHSFNLPSIYISIQLAHKLLQLLCPLQNEKRFDLKFTLHVSHLKLYKSFWAEKSTRCIHGFCNPHLYADDTQISTWSPDFTPKL